MEEIDSWVELYHTHGDSLIIFRPKHTHFTTFCLKSLFCVFYPSQIYLFLTFLSQIIPRPDKYTYVGELVPDPVEAIMKKDEAAEAGGSLPL